MSSRKLAIVSLVLAAVIALALWVASRPASMAPSTGPAAATAPAESQGSLAKPEVSDRREQVEPIASAPAVLESVAPNSASVVFSGARFVGRFLFADGQPAHDVHLSLSAYEARASNGWKPPADWKDVLATSGPDGRFELSTDRAAKRELDLEANLAGFDGARWSWHDIAPGSTTDVGDVTLLAVGSVRGRVVGRDGQPTGVVWNVDVERQAGTHEGGRSMLMCKADSEPATGEFRFDAAPPGAVRLSARSLTGDWIEDVAAEVRSGDETTVELRFNGPDLRRKLVIELVPEEPYRRVVQLFDAIDVRGPNGFTRTLEPEPRTWSRIDVEDLAPGDYTLELRSARYEPCIVHAVPGNTARIQLVGTSALKLAIVDAMTNARVDHAGVELTIGAPGIRPEKATLSLSNETLPEGGLYTHVPGGDWVLTVRVDGYAPLEIQPQVVQPGETRAIEARLTRGARIAGRVTSAESATPIEGVLVRLEPHEKPDPFASKNAGHSLFPEGSLTTHSAADGSFAFAALDAGPRTLRAIAGPGVACALELEVAVDSQRDDLVLTLPATGRLVGHIVGLDKLDASGWGVWARPSDAALGGDPARRTQYGPSADNTIDVASDGTFRSAWLPAGMCGLQLVLPKQQVSTGTNQWTTVRSNAFDLAQVDIPAGGTIEREFDLGTHLPGRLRIRANVSGAVASGLAAALYGTGRNLLGAAQLDVHGEGVTGLMWPGPAVLVVHPADPQWMFQLPGTVEVRSGAETIVDVAIALSPGVLRILDPAGAPVASTAFALQPDVVPSAMSIDVATDADGRIGLQLPSGSWHLARKGRGPSVWTAFDWPPRSSDAIELHVSAAAH